MLCMASCHASVMSDEALSIATRRIGMAITILVRGIIVSVTVIHTDSSIQLWIYLSFFVPLISSRVTHARHDVNGRPSLDFHNDESSIETS